MSKAYGIENANIFVFILRLLKKIVVMSYILDLKFRKYLISVFVEEI